MLKTKDLFIEFKTTIYAIYWERLLKDGENLLL